MKTDPELFETYRKQLCRRLKKQYQPLLALLVPAHFIWQVDTMWIMIKQRPTDDQTYEQGRKAILTPQPNDEYDYETAMKGPSTSGQIKQVQIRCVCWNMNLFNQSFIKHQNR